MSRIRSEKAWLACAEPAELVAYLGRRVGPRRWRLFAAACYRQVWDELPPVCRQAVETAERYADGAATRAELGAAQEAVVADARLSETWRSHAGCGRLCSLAAAEWMAAYAARDLSEREPLWDEKRARDRVACDMLRDLHPYAPPRTPAGFVPAFDPAWRTETVVGLAGAIYRGFRFADMPVLADALEEAGCGSPRLLAHCRHAAPHTRGCWALDAVLRG